MRQVIRFFTILMSLYAGGFLTIEVLKKLEKEAIIKISKGLSPMRDFNKKLFEK